MKEKRLKKGLRVGAMALMLLLLVGGVTGSAALGTPLLKKEKYTADQIETAFQILSPYIKINDDYTLTLDTKEAQKSGVSREALSVGKRYVKLNNKMVDAYRSPDEKLREQKLDEVDQELKVFEPFFRRVATTGLNAGQNSDVGIASSEACGGGYDNPHSCPPRIESGVYRDTLQEIRNYLVSHGYHATAGYACGGGSGACEYDYTKVVSAYGCSGGPFRSQAIIHPAGNSWTALSQKYLKTLFFYCRYEWKNDVLILRASYKTAHYGGIEEF